MHTSEYEHIKRGKESSSFYFFFIACVPSFFTARFSGNHLLPLASSGIPLQTMNNLPPPVIADSRLFQAFIARLTGCPPLFRPILDLRSSRVSAGVYAIRPFRLFRCLDGRSKRLYALYASKTHLCALCGNITPELTAYNAYKKTVWLRSRAESTKMYAVGDAYRLHTKCIQSI